MRTYLLAGAAAGLVAVTGPAPADRDLADSFAADTTRPTSSAWLGLLPDGETKRRFILDCTGCHQFDTRMAMPQGKPRTRSEWAAAVTRMLGYAGPATGFPVISAAQSPDSTAAWVHTALAARTPSRPAASRVPRRPGMVTEFDMPVPTDLPHDLAVERSGRVIVTGMFSHVMLALDPASGAIERVEIPVEKANPRAIEIDSAGRWWVVLGGPGQVARFDGLRWDTFEVGMYAHSIAVDRAGAAWVNGHFTRSPELVAEVAPSGSVRKVELPPHPTMADVPGGPIPYELRAGADGRIWMSELQGNRIVSLDPRTGATAAYTLPTSYSGPRRFDLDARGILWIPAYSAGLLVRFDPMTREFREIPLPIRDALPYVVRVDQQTGTVWIGTGGADELLAYEPASGRFEAVQLPSRGALVRRLAIDPRTRDVWMAYGESPGKLPARIARFSPRSRP